VVGSIVLDQMDSLERSQTRERNTLFPRLCSDKKGSPIGEQPEAGRSGGP
jgi:hypothetical protein